MFLTVLHVSSFIHSRWVLTTTTTTTTTCWSGLFPGANLSWLCLWWERSVRTHSLSHSVWSCLDTRLRWSPWMTWPVHWRSTPLTGKINRGGNNAAETRERCAQHKHLGKRARLFCFWNRDKILISCRKLVVCLVMRCNYSLTNTSWSVHSCLSETVCEQRLSTDEFSFYGWTLERVGRFLISVGNKGNALVHISLNCSFHKK